VPWTYALWQLNPSEHADNKNQSTQLRHVLLLMLALILLASWGDSLPTPSLSPITVTPVFAGKVDVGGYGLYLECAGTGSPTVVLESGLGDPWGFGKLIPYIAQHTRVCSYSRAGLGQSDPAPQRPRSTQAMAQDLHTLLDNAHMAGPYVLVGHSIAVLNLFLYVKQYPQEVVGLMLVDVATPDEWYQTAQGAQAIPTASPQWQQSAASLYGANDEGFDMVTSAIQVHEVGTTLGDLPFVVVSAQRSADTIAQRRKMAGLSSNGTLIVAKTTAHVVQGAEPVTVLNAIVLLLEKAKHYKP
jgi:pimeloyl-ACP methyl ester carboxylesterase